MFIGRTSIMELVRKFWIPFLVEANLTRFSFAPVVFCKDPSVRNLNRGPLARAIAVRMGLMTSSACRIVGAVQT